MADDQTQRPYRSSDSIARAPAKPPGMSSGGGSGNDPLAELARLIGQTDPFAEYGRTQAAADTRAVAPPTQNYYAAPPAAPLPHEADPHAFESTNFDRQSFGSGQLPPGSDLYQNEPVEHAYPAAAQDGGYEGDGYHPDQVHRGADQDDYYDDVAPNRRRMSIMVVAGIFALAVIGSAGALGYRAMFGKSASSGPPPVIKAETAPSKIVPTSSSRDPQSNKLITDRVNERGQGEKLVSREEQPIDIKDKAGTVFPAAQDQASAPAVGSGVVSPDAKRVRTIAIHPDQSVVADATPTAAAPAPPARATSVTPGKQAMPPAPQQQQSPRTAASPPSAAEPEPEAAARVATTRVTAPAPTPSRHAAAPGNAPLSLSPVAPTRTPPRAAAPVRTASAPAAQTPPAAASGGGGSYAVQVSSQRSEAEAQASFRSLQSKYPAQLGGKQAMIHKVDLGAKGVYYRALVGPFATGNEATELCSALKAAGGSCLIQRN